MIFLPQDLLSGTYKKPDIFLCESDKTKICKLETFNTSGVLKFNAYSELTFDVARVYNDILTGETLTNPYYNKIEALRLVAVDGFGYFELQDPDIDGDGIKEIKSLTAYSLEYTLSQKYLEKFYINRGTVDSVEVLYMEEQKNAALIPVTFCNDNIPELSLIHIILEKLHGSWTIGHVDASLKTMSRQFEVERQSIYDFIMNEICQKFNCYVVFDTVNNTINFYAETSVNKFTGDGVTNTFAIYPVFKELGTVSVDGYKTIDYTYNNITGQLTLGNIPSFGAIIEVTDGSLSSWETDVYITFDNLAQQMNISYAADSIKTVLTVKGADDLDIREVNNGLPYIVDLSYFYNVDWMGQELYDAYTAYLEKCATEQGNYKANAQKIIELSNKISYETNRLSLQYSEAHVTVDTVGTYYVRGGDYPDYYYTEVSLPADYIAGMTYYSTKTTDLTEEKVAELYEALKTYYHTGEMTGFTDKDSTLADAFSFMKSNKIEDLVNVLSSEDSTDSDKDTVILAFFAEMWEQLGLTPLKTLYLTPYKEVQTVNVSAGWSEKNNANYGLYYPVVLIIQSLESAIKKRQATIDLLSAAITKCREDNATIGRALLIDNNFTAGQMMRLSAFLREDEYIDDNFVATGNESTEELFKLKQELLECGRIELSKLCEPCLKFSMSLANIYALPEFAPIVHQFQLGNLIKVALRPDYIKRARLMQVNLNFEDFSDFSCEFGDLSSVRSQSDLHADLLSSAISAGKSVASNASYWNKGADTATAIDVRVQQGLLNAATEIKAIDGNQKSFIDRYGIHLQADDPERPGEISPEQGWIVNNKFLYSDDAFKTTKSVFGKYNIPAGISDDGEMIYDTKWGLLADAVIAGYIEGSTMKGGTIQIGERGDGTYNFEVDAQGAITMTGGKVESNGTTIDLDSYNTTAEITATSTMFTSDIQQITLICRLYSYGIEITETQMAHFQWKRSTNNSEADQEWNSSHNNDTNANTIVITPADVTDVAFFQCQVEMSSGTKLSNSIALTVYNSDINVFTSKPEFLLSDGYYYHVGDLWVVGSDYSPSVYRNGDKLVDINNNALKYSQNTILVSTANGVSYADADWVESIYYSQSFQQVQSWQNNMQEHVQILNDGLHLVGPVEDGIAFESILKSKKLVFGSKSGEKYNDVVWIGIDDTTARNFTAANYINIQSELVIDQDDYVHARLSKNPYISIGNFVLQIEENESLSII